MSAREHTPTPRVTTFTVEHQDGTYRWAFWRDPRRPAGWVLRTHDGCEREIGRNWADAAPRIRSIAENYGVACYVS